MTGQLKASLVEHVMLRRIMLGLTLCVALAFSLFVGVRAAEAQPAPLCTRFSEGPTGQDNWGPCPGAPNIVVTTSNTGSIGGATDYYLHLRDTAGASAACSTDEKYLGDWVKKMGECGQFCFDFKLFKSGTPPASIHPSFSIYNGGQRAVFVANVVLTSADPWQQNICAPIKSIVGGEHLPSNSSGEWRVEVSPGNWSNAYNAAWNTIITGVTMIQFPIDFTSDPSEEAGYDNLCMKPGDCEVPPPKVTGCLEDSKIEVKCNGDGTYTVTLNGGAFTGNVITLTSHTPGVTVTPPQQVWSASTSWTIVGATPGQTVTLTANATQIGGGGEKDTDLCCSGEIVIVMPDCPPEKVGEVIVEKKVVNNTHAETATIAALTFPMDLTCGPPSTLNVSFGLHDGGSHTESNIPYGSLCSVTEPSLPPAPAGVCEKGFTAVWAAPVISVTPSATIGVPVTVFTVVNELNCVEGEIGRLAVTKIVSPDPLGIGTGMLFPATVTCTNPAASYPVTLHGNTSTVPISLPLGSQCSVTETLPALPSGCTWLAPVYSTATVIIGGGIGILTVTNAYRCEKPTKPIDLRVDKEDMPWIGATNGFYVWVTNVGAPISFQAGELTVTDAVPLGMTATGVTAPNWTCSPLPLVGAGTLTCVYNLAGSLATGQSPTDSILINGFIAGAAPLENCATVAAAPPVGTDTNPANDTSCVTFAPEPPSRALTVSKKVTNKTKADLSGWQYPVTVTCDPAPNASFNLADGQSNTVNLPAGVDCKVGEDVSLIALPEKGCPRGEEPQWSLTISPTGLAHAGDTFVVENLLQCVKSEIVVPELPTCDPSTTKLSGDTCSCRYRRMTRTSPTTCMCRERTHLVEGKGCVADLACRRPQVLNSAGTACECPEGLEKRGNRCVAPLECRRPMIPNSRGTACECPDGLEKRGNRCVEVQRLECRPPMIPNSRGTACECPEGLEKHGNRCVRVEREIPDLPDLPRLPSFDFGGQDEGEPDK